MTRFQRFVLLILVCCAIPACDGKGDARSVWTDIIKKCAKNDLLGSNVLYFGPSNSIGPGSIWRKTSDGGYYVRWLLTNVDAANSTPLVNEGQKFTCSGEATSNVTISPSVALENSVAPVGGDIAADFSKAKKTNVSVDSVQWMEIVEGPYEAKIKNLDSTSPVKADLLQGNRFIIERAVKVTGMTADLEFSHDDGVKLHAKYNGPLGSLGTGNLGVGLTAEWKGDTTLHLTSTADFFVAGEMRQWTPMGLSATSKTSFGPTVTGVDKAAVGHDDTIK